jgi:hypothetical protein
VERVTSTAMVGQICPGQSSDMSVCLRRQAEIIHIHI